MITVADLMITSLDTIKAYTLKGDPRFILDELQDATIANSQETTDITGKQGRRLGRLKRNKGVTISGTNGILSAGLLEAQTGGTFKTISDNSAPVEWVDFLTVSNNAATTEFTATGTAGKEIAALYVLEGGVAKKELTQGTTAADGVFTYTAASKTLTFSGLDNGTEIAVYYTRNVNGYVLENDAEKYSEKLRLYIDGTAEDKCGNVYYIQFYVPKADFSGTFDLALGGDQTVHNFEAESLAGTCGANGYLWTYTVFGTETTEGADGGDDEGEDDGN